MYFVDCYFLSLDGMGRGMTSTDWWWSLVDTIEQDFYQTYARITGNQGFVQIFLGPFLSLNT